MIATKERNAAVGFVMAAQTEGDKLVPRVSLLLSGVGEIGKRWDLIFQADNGLTLESAQIERVCREYPLDEKWGRPNSEECLAVILNRAKKDEQVSLFEKDDRLVLESEPDVYRILFRRTVPSGRFVAVEVYLPLDGDDPNESWIELDEEASIVVLRAAGQYLEKVLL